MDEELFEWDDRKAEANDLKHGVRFDEAATAFTDRLAWLAYDGKNSTASEDRFVVIGESEKGRLVVVAYCERGDRIRIISARLATPTERRDYEANI